MSRALCLCALVSCLAAFSPAAAAVSATEVGRLEIPLFEVITNPGSIFGEYPHEPALLGTDLYLPLGTFSDGFLVIDLADPARPRLRSQFSAIRSRDVAVGPGRLYSVDGNEFHALDVTDPSQPRLLGALDLNPSSGSAAASVAAQGAVAFVTGGGPFLGGFPALRAIDISNPALPRALGGSAESGGADVFLSGSLAFVASYGAGLRIYDVSNPSAIRLLGSAGTLGSAAKVQVVGNLAYVYNTGNSFSLAVVEVSDPSRPFLLANMAIPSDLVLPEDWFSPSEFHGMRVSGARAYLSGWHGVVVVDVSQPEEPEILGRIGAGDFTGGVELLGDLLVVVNRIGVQVLRLGADPIAVGAPALDSDGKLALSAEGSFDEDGSIVAYRWSLTRTSGGGSHAFEGAFVSLAGVPQGVYQVSLIVEDDSGALSAPAEFPLAIPASGDPAELEACLDDNAALKADNAEAERGLQEILQLLQTPRGQRESSSDYQGAFGELLDRIIDLLLGRRWTR